jgi:hypothetical protein
MRNLHPVVAGALLALLIIVMIEQWEIRELNVLIDDLAAKQDVTTDYLGELMEGKK